MIGGLPIGFAQPLVLLGLLSLPVLARLRTLAEDRIDPQVGRSAQPAEG